mmetsp:Transcript_2246/g.2331  ORF Transcript_2246/g.2331 Transcript_2246/m.2331 type:complete len:91 (-) Transcript_2246:451-723(-)
MKGERKAKSTLRSFLFCYDTYGGEEERSSKLKRKIDEQQKLNKQIENCQNNLRAIHGLKPASLFSPRKLGVVLRVSKAHFDLCKGLKCAS